MEYIVRHNFSELKNLVKYANIRSSQEINLYYFLNLRFFLKFFLFVLSDVEKNFFVLFNIGYKTVSLSFEQSEIKGEFPDQNIVAQAEM